MFVYNALILRILSHRHTTINFWYRIIMWTHTITRTLRFINGTHALHRHRCHLKDFPTIWKSFFHIANHLIFIHFSHIKLIEFDSMKINSELFTVSQSTNIIWTIPNQWVFSFWSRRSYDTIKIGCVFGEWVSVQIELDNEWMSEQMGEKERQMWKWNKHTVEWVEIVRTYLIVRISAMENGIFHLTESHGKTV